MPSGANAIARPSTGSPGFSRNRQRRLLVAVLFVLTTGVAAGCGPISEAYKFISCIASVFTACGDDPSENQPAADCIHYLNGQSVGTKPCGPQWDSDNDTISTATETNPTNRTDNSPISGFYTFDTVRWDIDRSHAGLGPDDGFLDYGMNLKDQGPGRFHYLGNDQVDTDDWGTGHLLRLIEGSGRDWADTLIFSAYPRLLSGDMSLRTGGSFPPHVSHRNGVDVDMRYIRKDRSETDTLNICTQAELYDTAATISLWNTIIFRNGDGRNGRPLVEAIFADTACVGIIDDEGYHYITHVDDHQNHFHVRIRDPDGTPN